MAFRARKAGEGLKARKKLEQKYDEDDALGIPSRLVEWINATLDGEHAKIENVAGLNGEGVSWRKFQFSLRDGVVICRMMNKLLAAEGKPLVKFNPSNTSSGYVALENIRNFNKSAESYGIPEELSFTSEDLHEGVKGPFAKVIVCLHNLGIQANSKSFEPKYEVREIKENGCKAEETDSKPKETDSNPKDSKQKDGVKQT